MTEQTYFSPMFPPQKCKPSALTFGLKKNHEVLGPDNCMPKDTIIFFRSVNALKGR